MAAGDTYSNCTERRGLEQILQEMFVIDGFGKPVLRGIDPLNSAVSQTSFVGAVSTAANISDYQTWKTANPTKRVLRVTPMNISATVSALLVEYTD